MIRITLNEYERRVVVWLAKMVEKWHADHATIDPIERRAVRRSIENRINGFGAEMACAKYLDRFWLCNPTEPGQPDLSVAEVRWRSRATYDLPIYKTDPDKAFILTLGKMPEFNLMGWVMSEDAKQDKYWSEFLPWPCYLYPKDKLRPMEAFPREVNR